jgi:predicted  nucleic acid-binding Zn-ribbon protein
MIQKIKDLMQTKELIDEINKKVSDHSDGVNSLQKELAELNTQLAGIKGSQTEFLTNFKDNLDVITDSKESLKKELYDFRLLKSQLQKTIMDKFERELDDELKVYSDKIKNDINEYNQLKDQMSSAVSQVKNISNEIAKLVDISKNIKKEDFELTKFSNQLKESDKEKLELMRKIDSLERLISKMRRQR